MVLSKNSYHLATGVKRTSTKRLKYRLWKQSESYRLGDPRKILTCRGDLNSHNPVGDHNKNRITGNKYTR